MSPCNLGYLPLAIVAIMGVTGTITMYLSYFKYKHVTYMLPYISDTGTYPPESCIFGQGLNIVAILLALLFYVKYRQVQEIYRKHHIDEKYQLNKLALTLGMASSVGMTIVANFQETNILSVHWIGAILIFGGTSFNACVQTLIYIKITPVIGQGKTTMFRIFLSVSAIISFFLFSVGAFIAFGQFKGENMTKWSAEDGGYTTHLISTYAEWICAVSALTYLLSMTQEFKKITIKGISMDFDEHKTKNSNIISSF